MAAEAKDETVIQGTDGADETSRDQIEAEIEATREELGDTVAELADKADVKKQAKRKVTETKAKATAKKEAVKDKVGAQKEAVTGKVQEASPDSAQEAAAKTRRATAQAAQAARQNPLPTAAIAAFAGGLWIGWRLGRR